jgi:DNA-binding FadR family transcriptional regulator
MRNDSSPPEAVTEGLLRPMATRSVVDRIIGRLTDAILSGELRPGQRIPTEAELSESMQVGRNSVREAIKSLETMGVLKIRRSEGTFVAEGFSDRMMAPMIYGMVLEGSNSYALVELRRLLEVGILSLAIQKATDDDLAVLRRCLAELEKTAGAGAEPERIQDADIAFHEALLSCARNPLVNKIYDIIEKLSRHTRILAVERFVENGKLDEMVDLHRELLRIVEERESQSIHPIIDRHFMYWTETLPI